MPPIRVSGRAQPMAPEDRRASLVVATIPLLCQYGRQVTTRQIADAAGVAEGTIFRAFKDKEELIKSAIDAAFDPLPTLAELDGIDREGPLRERLVAITAVLQRRLQLVFNLMIALGMSSRPKELERRRRAARSAQASIVDRIVIILDTDRVRFRYPVPEVARLLRLVTFAGSHPMITDGHLLTPEQIADLMLDGVRRHAASSQARREPHGREHGTGRM